MLPSKKEMRWTYCLGIPIKRVPIECVKWAEEPPGLDVHHTLAQRFLHWPSAVHIQCNTWAYLTVYDGLGFIFLNPIGFFYIFFPSDPAAAAEGCAGSMLISFARGVSGVEALQQHSHFDWRGEHWIKGMEVCSWYWGQHTKICLVALYIRLNIVSAVGLVCISLYNVMTYLC